MEILHLDADLLAINKPAGLLSLPDGYDKTPPHVKSVLEPEFGRLWVVHRLDKDTSGVLLLARNAAAHKALNTQFDGHRVRKVYHALVEGNPPWESITLDAPLRPDGDRRHRTAPHPQGKSAVTHVRVLERFRYDALPKSAMRRTLSPLSLVEAIPETGRTHQIRAHLAFAGFPLVSDELYGDATGAPASPCISRCALHACSIAFDHPTTEESLCIEASYPADFNSALQALRAV